MKSPRQKLLQKTVLINRAPLLALWITIVALREGHSEDDALRAGRAISGMLAESKGRRLGITLERQSNIKNTQTISEKRVDIAGFSIPLVRFEKVSPKSMKSYFIRSFRDEGVLQNVSDALMKLARSYKKNDIGKNAYKLYEIFRPQIADGLQGWGQRGILYIDIITRLCASGHKK